MNLRLHPIAFDLGSKGYVAFPAAEAEQILHIFEVKIPELQHRVKLQDLAIDMLETQLHETARTTSVSLDWITVQNDRLEDCESSLDDAAVTFWDVVKYVSIGAVVGAAGMVAVICGVGKCRSRD